MPTIKNQFFYFGCNYQNNFFPALLLTQKVTFLNAEKVCLLLFFCKINESAKKEGFRRRF
jgi:hypothetical protein